MKDAQKGNYDDAVSNVLGSNIFDVCFALGFPLFLFTIIYGPIEMGSRIKLGDYAKICVNLNKKNFRSVTPRSCILKDFIFALKDSALAFVLLLTK